jgi:glycosyltransferase involved in cell wall biosynthesis
MILQTDYLSIVIPVFNRYHYLETLLDSIFEHADYPFEIILHDDGSGDGTLEKIIEKASGRVSTVISNPNKGWNVGLAESIDRATALATSNYIVMLNADCKFLRPCFKDIVHVLDKQYVGFIALHEANDLVQYYNSSGTNFMLQSGLGSGCALAYRKDVWQKVDGFAGVDGMWSGGADTHFINAVWQAGYFRASLDGAQPVYNMSLLDLGNKDTTINGQVNDCSFPHIFTPKDNSYNFREQSRSRYGHIDHYKHSIEHQPFQRNNSNFWHEYTTNFVQFPEIRWGVLANDSPHLRWRNDISNEKLYTKE